MKNHSTQQGQRKLGTIPTDCLDEIKVIVSDVISLSFLNETRPEKGSGKTTWAFQETVPKTHFIEVWLWLCHMKHKYLAILSFGHGLGPLCVQ